MLFSRHMLNSARSVDFKGETGSQENHCTLDSKNAENRSKALPP